MGFDCSKTRVWMVLAVAFFALACALCIALICEKNLANDNSGENFVALSKEDVLKKFPFFFRKEEEQKALEKYYIDMIYGNVTLAPIDRTTATTPFPLPCGSQCNNGSQHTTVNKETLSQDPNIYHGCCNTVPGFISPVEAQNTYDHWVVVAQFQDRRQYFPNEKCRQEKACTWCRCAQQTALFSAVIDTEPNDGQDKYTIGYIKLPGCCKCYNNLPGGITLPETAD